MRLARTFAASCCWRQPAPKRRGFPALDSQPIVRLTCSCMFGLVALWQFALYLMWFACLAVRSLTLPFWTGPASGLCVCTQTAWLAISSGTPSSISVKFCFVRARGLHVLSCIRGAARVSVCLKLTSSFRPGCGSVAVCVYHSTMSVYQYTHA